MVNVNHQVAKWYQIVLPRGALELELVQAGEHYIAPENVNLATPNVTFASCADIRRGKPKIDQNYLVGELEVSRRIIISLFLFLNHNVFQLEVVENVASIVYLLQDIYNLDT